MKLVGDVENLEDRRSYRVQILPGCVRDFFYTLNALPISGVAKPRPLHRPVMRHFPPAARPSLSSFSSVETGVGSGVPQLA